MRATALFMPTIKEDPADAEAVSHKLMVRGGFVRQFASGIYIMLPLGWRVMKRICAIIREEMDAIGALELSMPTLHPADVWQATGRYDAIGSEMFRLKDRGGRDMVLAMTHEEVFAWLAARELRSYRDLPQIWYQLQLKFRDEPRPKGGVLRVREFLMKDSYSFDLDDEGLELSYAKHIVAYDRIFDRCGLEFYRVESDSGFMGGAQAHEYMAPSAAGEDRVALCPACGYAANLELARSIPRATAGRSPVGPLSPGPSRAAGLISTAGDQGRDMMMPVEVPTPGRRTIEEVATFLEIAPDSLIKSLVYIAGEQPVLALLRGDHSLHENKLARYLKAPVRPARAEEIRDVMGTDAGFVGPVDLPARDKVRVIADESLRPTDDVALEYVVGANKTDTHLVGVVVGREFSPEYADLREAEAGDACPECGEPLVVKQVIEVGNIFKLGTKYSKPLSAYVLDESGDERAVTMGSYGIGPARIAAAAVEQSNDDRGIIWPKSMAPFDVHIVQVHARDEDQTRVASSLHDQLAEQGWEVLWDDRDERPGFKFADAELIGCPVRITVGKKAAVGLVEVQPRAGGATEEVDLSECGEYVRRLWAEAR